jgi:6-phosphogluconolactonase
MVTDLRPGAPRGSDAPPRERDKDIWAADIHLTPDGRFLYTSERTSSTLCAYQVEAASGKLAWLGATPTEKQPRGFAIDPQGKFLVSTGEKSTTVSVHAINGDGSLGAARQFPGGKGGNWVEIVAF